MWYKGLGKPRVPVKLFKTSRYMGEVGRVWKNDNREKERGSVSGSVCVCFVVSGEESGDVENFQGREMDPREVSTRYFLGLFWIFFGSWTRALGPLGACWLDWVVSPTPIRMPRPAGAVQFGVIGSGNNKDYLQVFGFPGKEKYEVC